MSSGLFENGYPQIIHLLKQVYLIYIKKIIFDIIDIKYFYLISVQIICIKTSGLKLKLFTKGKIIISYLKSLNWNNYFKPYNCT